MKQYKFNSKNKQKTNRASKIMRETLECRRPIGPCGPLLFFRLPICQIHPPYRFHIASSHVSYGRYQTQQLSHLLVHLLLLQWQVPTLPQKVVKIQKVSYSQANAYIEMVGTQLFSFSRMTWADVNSILILQEPDEPIFLAFLCLQLTEIWHFFDQNMCTCQPKTTRLFARISNQKYQQFRRYRL